MSVQGHSERGLQPAGPDDPPATVRLNRPGWLLARAALRWLLKGFFALRGTLRVRGAHRLPRRRRPLIIVSNHPSLLDTALYACAIGPRVVVCGAKPRYFGSPARRALMALGNVMRVDGREQYLADCARWLAAGEVLLAFPEMGRNAEGTGPFSPWIAELALQLEAAILPCHILHQDGGRRQSVITVGEEFVVPAGPPASARQLAASLRERVLALARASTSASAGAQEGAQEGA